MGAGGRLASEVVVPTGGGVGAAGPLPEPPPPHATSTTEIVMHDSKDRNRFSVDETALLATTFISSPYIEAVWSHLTVPC
jgi:hypothetical protein